MKITFVGLTISSSWGNGHATPYRALLRALARRGHKLVFYERDVEYYFSRRDFEQCDYCRLELYADWQQVRARALADARSSDAVVLGSFVPDGTQVADDLLALQNPLRVFYDLDTPVTLARLAKGDAGYIRGDQLSRFDLVLSFTGGQTLDILRRDYGARHVEALYGCVDPDVYKRTPIRTNFRSDLSYMGTYSADRQDKLDAFFLEPARRMPRRIFVLAGALYPWEWGPYWPRNVFRMEHVAPADHPAFYSSSRLTLNITRDTMATYGYCPSGRFFEAAACGTPIVSDTWPGIEEFFRDGQEIFLARKFADVMAAMQRTDMELARVAKRARERTLDEHTGDRRAKQLLAYFEQARADRAERHAEAA